LQGSLTVSLENTLMHIGRPGTESMAPVKIRKEKIGASFRSVDLAHLRHSLNTAGWNGKLTNSPVTSRPSRIIARGVRSGYPLRKPPVTAIGYEPWLDRYEPTANRTKARRNRKWIHGSRSFNASCRWKTSRRC
jgi:hypothetical protein